MEAVLKQLNAPHLSNHYVKWYLQQILSENGIVFIETIPLCKVKMSRLARLWSALKNWVNNNLL